jgi:cytochrome c-type biogenesis protein CcmH
MRRWLAILVLGLASVTALAIDTEVAFPDAARQQRYDRWIHELRCVQCQNAAIADSPVGLASDLRRQVKEMIAAGQSDEEIKRFMTERYGDFVLYDPPLKPRTYFLWAAPALFLLITVGVAARVIVRRSKGPIDSDPEEPA